MAEHAEEDLSAVGLKHSTMSVNELADVAGEDDAVTSTTIQPCGDVGDAEDGQVQVVVDDTGVSEQFTVVPVHEGEQELSMEVSTASVDAGIDEQPAGFSPFGAVTTTYVEPAENDDDFEGQCQPVVIQHMDIAQPLSTLRRLLEAQLNISLHDYEFWLQDSIKLDASKNLTSQCVQGCGLVQVNVEIKTMLAGLPRINITDVLKPADDDDEDVKPNMGVAAAAAAAPQRTPKYKQRGQNRPAARTTRVPLMADAENVTRWIVDQQFRETQIQLGIPLDPMDWSTEQVKFWLEWAIVQFGLRRGCRAV